MKNNKEHIGDTVNESNKQYGFIKLYNSFLNWEWYSDVNMVRLFIHLILSANWTNKKWKGVVIEKGQLITSYRKLSNQTGLTIQNVRTCLNRLKSTSEITIKSTNKYQSITIVNYGFYQYLEKDVTSKSTSKLTNNQQTTNKQLTTTKEYKEYKEYKDNNINNIFLSDIKISDVPKKDLKYYKIAKAFYDIFLNYKKSLGLRASVLKKAKYGNFVDPIKRLYEIDKVSPEQLETVYKFLKDKKTQSSEFWLKNIQSTNKLREQFERLYAEAKKTPKIINKTNVPIG